MGYSPTAPYNVQSANLSDVPTKGTGRFNLRIPSVAMAQAASNAGIGNINIASAPASLDGFSFVSSGLDSLLLTAQSTASQNGPWIWNGAGSALTRPSDFPTGGVITTGREVSIGNGTQNAGTKWMLAVPSAGVTIDTTAQTWVARNITGTTQNESVITANSLDQFTAPANNVSFNNKQLKNLGAATLGTDGAQYQQLPAATTFTGAFTTANNGTTNVNTFVGSQTFTVASNAGAASTGYLTVIVGGNAVTISYTGIGANTFTGCTTLFGGAGALAVGNQVAYAVNFTPTVTGPYEITTVGGGGGGGSGGSPATSGTNQSGGGGGGCGMTSLNIQNLVANTTYTVTAGFGGTGGAATAGGSAAAGAAGNNGSPSYFNGVTVTSANGGGGGSGGPATSTAAISGGGWGGSNGVSSAITGVGCGGGSATFTTLSSSGLGQALLAAGGGGGGGTATSSLGGGGGAAGAFGTNAVAGAAGASGTHAGVAGADAAAGTGAGGGGGGGACGAATIGASGKGGAGGGGLVIIIGPLAD